MSTLDVGNRQAEQARNRVGSTALASEDVFFSILAALLHVYSGTCALADIIASDHHTAMTDTTFIARLQRHDLAAYDDLVAQYSDVLYRYLYHSTRDYQQSEALLTATFVRVVERIHIYRPDDPPLVVWLHRIAQTTLRDMGASPGHTTPAPEPLDPLALDERQALLLRCIATMSLPEISYILAKSNDAAKQLQLQALRTMHTWLQ